MLDRYGLALFPQTLGILLDIVGRLCLLGFLTAAKSSPSGSLAVTRFLPLPASTRGASFMALPGVGDAFVTDVVFLGVVPRIGEARTVSTLVR